MTDWRRIRRTTVKILVCVKQVPDSGESQATLDSKSHTLRREKMRMTLNPVDGCCFETALRMKEKYGGSVSLVSMGRPETADMLRSLSAIGGDAFYLISDAKLAGADTYATAFVLGRVVQFLGGFDLILCGERTTDGETGQVGPSLAAMLEYNLAGGITEIELRKEEGGYAVCYTAKGGLEYPLPLVATVKRNCVLRYPTLTGLRRAVGREIRILDVSLLGADVESLTQVIAVERKEVGKRRPVWYLPEKEGLKRLLTESGLNAAIGMDE